MFGQITKSHCAYLLDIKITLNLSSQFLFKPCMQGANEEAKAVTKAPSMKG